jgi:hypothetical protein
LTSCPAMVAGTSFEEVASSCSSGKQVYEHPQLGHWNKRNRSKTFDFPIFLNADHTHSLAGAVEAAKAADAVNWRLVFRNSLIDCRGVRSLSEDR